MVKYLTADSILDNMSDESVLAQPTLTNMAFDKPKTGDPTTKGKKRAAAAADVVEAGSSKRPMNVINAGIGGTASAAHAVGITPAPVQNTQATHNSKSQGRAAGSSLTVAASNNNSSGGVPRVRAAAEQASKDKLAFAQHLRLAHNAMHYLDDETVVAGLRWIALDHDV